MSASSPKAPAGHPKKGRTIASVIESGRVSFSADQLAAALEDRARRTPGSAQLAVRERDFWERNSGVPESNPDAAAQASAGNAAAGTMMDSASLSGQEMAERTGLSPSTIRHYRVDRKIYSYTRGSAVLYPAWQLTNEGQLLPSLGPVIKALPQDLHPQTVAGLFTTPQPDLVLEGNPVSPKEWLERDGTPEPVIELADDFHHGY